VSSGLEVVDLVKTFGRATRVAAVAGVSLHVQEGQLLTLLGPSGCGKTTTLRCVAGLERPDSGEIAVGETVLYSSTRGVAVPANRRGLGLVSQSYGLWPHMTVFETVAFPLTVVPRRRRAGRTAIRERVERALAVVKLEGLEGRRTPELSGGQQQRLALARALVLEPRLLLMDEPLSNLDARLRDDMRLELKRLQRELGQTALYVTHDQAEAFALSNTVAVMRAGTIEQVGRPREVYERPASLFVAEFVGNTNLVDATVAERLDGSYAVETDAGPLVVRSSLRLRPGDAVAVAIRGEQIRLEVGEPAAGRRNVWAGTVSARAFRGDTIDHLVRVGERELRVRGTSAISLPPGTAVGIELPEAACSLIRPA
jgi:iron(III) transport system ATP-binding protein